MFSLIVIIEKFDQELYVQLITLLYALPECLEVDSD